MFMIRHIFYFIFIYLNGNLARFLTMVSPNWPFASKNFFSAKKLSIVGADWFSSAHIGAD